MIIHVHWFWSLCLALTAACRYRSIHRCLVLKVRMRVECVMAVM